ncbi:hypothetical protein [uncultured Bartonella sp.]|nr:hypothetical protein [uncultured Bartonella sp.]
MVISLKFRMRGLWWGLSDMTSTSISSAPGRETTSRRLMITPPSSSASA